MKISQNELERQRLLEWERLERNRISREYHQRVREEKSRAREEAIKTREEELRVQQEELKAAQDQARAAQEEARLARQVSYAEGLAQGIEISKLIVRIQLLQQLLRQPEMSSSELGRLTEANLQELEDALKQQLRGPKQTNGSGSTN